MGLPSFYIWFLYFPFSLVDVCVGEGGCMCMVYGMSAGLVLAKDKVISRDDATNPIALHGT